MNAAQCGVTLRRWLRATLGALALALSVVVHAHEARPAYLQIDHMGQERYDVLWRTPVMSGMRLPVVLKLPDGARDLRDVHVRELPDSLVERRTVLIDGGLAGKRIEFVGLQGTITDVLVRTQLENGAHATSLVRARQPWIDVDPVRGPLSVVAAYVAHGFEHILAGYDHLLFVLALVLLLRSRKLSVLFWTVTAFTLAHSITLALAALGVVNVPGPPVEAAIALSILLLATEIRRSRQGEPSLTLRYPWVVAFVFGLLHGLGFAGALTEVGLPPGDVPLALLSFNVGVELGQLAFIGVVLCLIAAGSRASMPPIFPRYAYASATFAIGTLAAFWFIERVAAFAPVF